MQGLTTEEAKKRLRIYGENRIERRKRIPPWKIFLNQFTSPLVLLLLVAALLSFSLAIARGEAYTDSILIIAIVLLACIAGFVQDYKAEQTIEALQRLATPKVKVIRDGIEQEISSVELVPGDIIVLEGGDVIPADAKLVKGELQVDESPLTGESRAVRKGEGDNVYSGCGVFAGKAVAEVFATGMRTELGKITAKMQEIEEEKTPFQLQMDQLTRKLVGITTVLMAITFFLSVSKFGVLEAGLLTISLAVAAIPEGLPAVITICLSLGAREMAKRNALVRRLVVTESIGTVDVICTDKTGTITEGKMKVVDLWFPKPSKLAMELALKVCFYCNDAKLIKANGSEKWIGDETDIALKLYANDLVRPEGKRIEEIAFTPERKLMTIVHEFDGRRLVLSKGAPEVVLQRCSKVFMGKEIKKLDKRLRARLLRKNEEFASKAYRVLALAFKEYEEPLEENLVFLALVLLADPPRKEARKAIRDCRNAGIRVIMITGDNPITAKAVADQVGIRSNGVLTGSELDRLSDEEIAKALKRGVNVFARTNPFHKLRILELLQREGRIVAMTGDGINDALALKRADVGIAMGIKGTEVAKEASDMILLDDNFASIRNAVREGRRIFDNIQKFVSYLFVCNIAELLVVFLGLLLFAFEEPLLFPIQILWINLLTDGLPAIALGLDPARPDVLKRKPRRKEEGIIDRRLSLLIPTIGIKKSLLILLVFYLVLGAFGLEKARTTLFTCFIIYEFIRIAVIRFQEKIGFFSNKFLIGALLATLAIHLAVIYTPLGRAFHVVPLGFYEWFILGSGALVGFVTSIAITKVVMKWVG